MIKKILAIGSFAAIAAAFGFNSNNSNNSNNEVSVTDLMSTNTEALAYCPNGCVEGGNDCYCNGYHSNYKEYDGWG